MIVVEYGDTSKTFLAIFGSRRLVTNQICHRIINVNRTEHHYPRPTIEGATLSMRGQLCHGHYLSNYVMEGEEEGNAQARLRA